MDKINTTSFSIITVCYNEGESIRITAESILKQTYKNYQWIIIDGGSKDQTLNILDNYKNIIHTLVSGKDSGIYDAMNKGLAYATGDYIIMMNGGDGFASSDVLERTAAFGTRNDILFGDQINEFGNVADFKDVVLNKKHFFGSKLLAHQATFVKKTIYDQHGGYDASYKITGDSEFFTKVFTQANHVSSQYLGFIVSLFNSNGMSCNPKNRPIMDAEYAQMNKKYFTQQDKFIYFLPTLKSQLRHKTISLLAKLHLYHLARSIYRKLKKVF